MEGQGHSDSQVTDAAAEARAVRRVPLADGPWWSRRPRPSYPPPTGCRRVWIPVYGFLDADADHRARVDRFFHVPMLVLALLVLPVLALEYLQDRDQQQREALASRGVAASAPASAPSAGSPAATPASRPSYPIHRYIGQSVIEHPVMRVIVDALMAFIWVAFLLEFVVKVSIAESRVRYVTKNWMDLVIILLPFLRPLRGMRALRVAKVARLSKVYMLRGVAMKLLRTLVAMVIGLQYIRRLQSRFSKPKADQPAETDYSVWSRASLIAEIRRLNERVKELEQEIRRESKG